MKGINAGQSDRGRVRPSLGETVGTPGGLRKAVFFPVLAGVPQEGFLEEEGADGMTEGGWGLQGAEPGSHCCGSGVLGRELGGLLEKSEAGGGCAGSLREAGCRGQQVVTSTLWSAEPRTWARGLGALEWDKL